MAIPTKDALLAPWANNFSTRISALGNPYSVSTVQATEMVSRTAAFVASYNTLMDARADGTKAESQTADKDAKKSALFELGRELYAFIAANTSISDADKSSSAFTCAATRTRPFPRRRLGLGWTSSRLSPGR